MMRKENITEAEKLRFLSFLLQYPDTEMIEDLREVGPEISEALDSAGCSALGELVAYFSSTPLLRLQENYTATFDLNTRHSLNLTYHRWGDRKERGGEIARFAEAYANAGYEPATGELPDFLPAVLEFMSVEDADYFRWIADEYTGSIEVIKTRLYKEDNPYRTIFDLLSSMFHKIKHNETGKCYG